MLTAASRRRAAIINSAKPPSSIEAVNFNNSTFQLPPLLTTRSPTPIQRDRFYRQTVSGVRSSNAPALTRVQVLLSRFPNKQHLLVEIDGSLCELFNHAEGTEAPIELTNQAVFQLSQPELYANNGDHFLIPAPGQALPVNAKRRARFFSFHVEIDPNAAFVGDDKVCQKANLKVAEFMVAVSLPIETPEIGHPNYGYDVLDASFTASVLRNPRQVLLMLQALRNDVPPVVGTLTKPSGHHFMRVDPSGFRRFFLDYFDRCRLELLICLLHQEYIGTAAVDDAEIENQLRNLRQIFWDPVSKKLIQRDVEAHHEEFQQILMLLQKYPGDVVSTFWNGLWDKI